MTAPLLGTDDQGNHDPGASPVELPNEPGFGDTWFDLKNKTFGVGLTSRPTTSTPCC